MKSDTALLGDLRHQKQQTTEALQKQSAHEIKLFLDYVEKEGIAPDIRYFSLTKMKFIPLWTIYHWYGYDDQAAYVSAEGKLYELRGIGYIAPASRYGKLHIGGILADMRTAREQQAAQATKRRRRTAWRSISR